MFACLLAGCHSKADLENINKQAELDLGLAFPVGSLHLTVGDFLGGDDLANIYLDDSAVYHFIDTIDLPKKHYHEINVDNYILQNENPSPLYLLPANGNKPEIIGDGSTVTELAFDLKVSTKKFYQDLNYERLDSVQVTTARFYSYTSPRYLDLNWSEIKKIEIELSDNHFLGVKDRNITIYTKGYDYSKDIMTPLNDFTLSLLKDKNDCRDGVVDEVPFRVKFFICPEDGHTVKLTDESRFVQNLVVEVANYKAAWGFFEASDDMKDESEVNIEEEWEDWKKIKKLKVRLMEPVVDVYATHKIAAPLSVHIDYLCAMDAQANKAYADWDGSHKMDSLLQKCLSPYSKSLEDSVSNKMRFCRGTMHGDIDKLFDVRPDFIRYSFYMKVDESHRDYIWRQHRLTHNDTIFGTAHVDIPFKVNKESEAEYVTTLTDVNISSISIDSIVASSNAIDSIKASEIKLILQVENGIPFEVEGTFTFLDKDSNELKLQLIEDSTKNHVRFPAPEMAIKQGEMYGYVVKPSVTRQVISIGKNEFERLAEVKSVRMDVAAVGNPQPCKITKYTDLRVRIGLAAKVDAILNFESANEDEKTDNKNTGNKN